MLRWVSPIKNMCRTVTHDTEFMGEQLLEGQKCMLLYESANRDETKFDDPFRFDVERQPNEHVAFGFGAHFCLGQALARLELRVMFEQLLVRMPDLELAVDPADLPRRPANFISGLESMPVRFTPSAATEPEHAVSDADANRALVERFWATLYERDFDGVGAFFAADGEYTDMPTPPEDVARGPEQIAARLRLGLEPLDVALAHGEDDRRRRRHGRRPSTSSTGNGRPARRSRSRSCRCTRSATASSSAGGTTGTSAR